ncbi:MAG: hypothetical protein IKK58_05185 [Clostridia bacterium]|nr:hypothetical protein [Clostridia bacterium]
MNTCASTINDACSAVLVKRLYDAVSLGLDGAVCTLELVEGKAAGQLPSGRTTQQLAVISELTLVPERRYRRASGYMTAVGACDPSGGSSSHLPCRIRIPFSSIIKYPEPSVMVPELSALVSLSFNAVKAISDTRFEAAVSGAAILTLCSLTPMSLPCATPLCPFPERKLDEKKVLPLFPDCPPSTR